MTTITVSNLPNINFYTGQDASFGGESVENRRYGYHSDYYGDLELSNTNNLYWSYISNSTFSENQTKYYNIGDIINATISYMNKFKNNKVDINVDKNVLTFNYKYETDLKNDFSYTSITPASQLIDLLLNVNDMTFNKRRYYGNNIELKEISYAHKKYPYHGPNTIITVNDVSSETGLKIYDFSKQFVDYKYTELSYDEQYTRHYMERYETTTGYAYIDTGLTYIETLTFYTYEINDINELNNRINTFFDNNSKRVENQYKKLKSYYISELDTVLTLTLNTYSLSSKKLYTYFNFNNNYNNWFDNSIAFTMDNVDKLKTNDHLLNIEPISQSWFNVIINDNDMPCGSDIQTDTLHEFKVKYKEKFGDDQQVSFKVINPSYIKTLDLSYQTAYITNVDLINNYNKRVDIYNVRNTNWINEGDINIENLIIGNNEVNSHVENISGINKLTSLKKIDITNCSYLTKDFSIRRLSQLNEFNANGSQITNFIPHVNNTFDKVTLPSTLKTLVLKNNTINHFEYTPTGNLINLTLENVQGINIQNFIESWIYELENKELGDTNVLHAGIIQNTNLVGINFENFNVETLLKFKYLGLNKFEGTIGIKGSMEDNSLTRHEYISLRNEFGDEIMETGKYKNIPNSKPIKFEYTLNNDIYSQKLYLLYQPYEDQPKYWEEDIIYDSSIHTANIIDNTGGNSLLDYFETIDTLQLTMNDEGFGYEVQLPRKIYTDNNDKSSLTKTLNVGDIVLYKGNKLILVTNYIKRVYNYVKLGELQFNEGRAKNIKISFIK